MRAVRGTETSVTDHLGPPTTLWGSPSYTTALWPRTCSKRHGKISYRRQGRVLAWSWSLQPMCSSHIYFGNLAPFFSAMSALSAPSSVLAVSAELVHAQQAPQGWLLLRSGRFAHTKEYVVTWTRWPPAQAGTNRFGTSSSPLAMRTGSRSRATCLCLRVEFCLS